MFKRKDRIDMIMNSRLLNQPPNMGLPFETTADTYYFPERVEHYDPDYRTGTIRWNRYLRKPRLSFNQIDFPFAESQGWEFPEEYEQSPVSVFEISFVTERTVRLRIGSRHMHLPPAKSTLMLSDEGANTSAVWHTEHREDGVVHTSEHGSVTVQFSPWKVIVKDKVGRVLTETRSFSDISSLLNTNGLPFCFTRSSTDMENRFAASFSLHVDEKLYGTGESFTRLDKRGQRIDLFTTDALSVQTPRMYKPIPFYLSSRGYGMFVHASSPLSFDFGASYDDTLSVYTGEEELDLFIFLGSPKEVLSEYTRLTGRSPLPPLWSFGLWMSRITYDNESEVREVAANLTDNRIPCDVIHLDTGWFEKDWRCNYQFSEKRFDDPARMISELKDQGYRISLWQLPYFTPTNPLFAEIVEQGLAVTTADGKLPTDDAILDFSNPETIKWYKKKLAGLLEMGVGAIKVDFGEAAPMNGVYASGKTGFHEHNLYPLRYNCAASEATLETNNESIIWARSAWAGSQRYPIHWGGDAENTDSAMASTLRGGLSLGLSGFSFWSHDIGGFVKSSPENLYRRWLPFGMLTSHSRCHGLPPKEPWIYGEAFTAMFRETVNLKYTLMPYVYTQAKLCTDAGHPMLRPLFLEYPEDPGSWLVEDEYLFGADLLVAPLFEEAAGRRVYLPQGEWIDYQSGIRYTGGTWHSIVAGDLPVVLLVRSGAVLIHMNPALSTAFLDWSELHFVTFAAAEEEEEQQERSVILFEPLEQRMYQVSLRGGAICEIRSDSDSVQLNSKPGWRAQSFN
jgi:alpha-D-xyloside xylohydrolase